MINPDRLTVKATDALNEAVDLARRAGNPLVYDLHLLLALLTQDEGIVVPVLQKLGVSVTQLREAVGREMARFPKQSNAQPTLSRELNQVFDKAEADINVKAIVLRVDSPGGTVDVVEIDSGHDVMISSPHLLAPVLDAIAGSST
jgi:ATP-dependent Clp protease ATP-binding subunit ClpA